MKVGNEKIKSMEDIKATSVFVSVIFEEAPEQWGLRGNPYSCYPLQD